MTSASVFPDSDELESESTNPELLSVTIPDRADAPVSEITERFFKAIVAKVPLDRIEELHLFAPLRQSGVETGIAVIAARVIVPVPPPAVIPETPLELALAETDDSSAVASDVQADVDADVIAGAHADVAAEADGALDPVGEVAREESAMGDVGASAIDGTEAPMAADDTDASPYAAETLHEIVVDATSQSMTTLAEPAAMVERHTVYTARYRLVQKGAERGKWEASVVDEADAPLITVEMVVRGVQRRAGEASETTRYTGAQIARALRLPYPS